MMNFYERCPDGDLELENFLQILSDIFGYE